MSLSRSPLELLPETETYALCPSGQRGYEVWSDLEDTPLALVDFDSLYRRARFPGYFVRRRRLTSSDLWLVDEDEGPVAVAQKEGWPLGLRYRVEWTGGELLLVGSRTTYLWEVFEDDEVVGELLAEPFTNGERRMTLPASAPDEVACFLVAVTELVRLNPALRLFDRATRPQLWT